MLGTFAVLFCVFVPSLYAKPTESPNTSTRYLEDILSYSNRNVDPCENFYEYACGNWKPSSFDSKKERNSLLMSSLNHVIKTINDFLVGNNADLDDVYPYQLGELRKYYKVCMKATAETPKKSDKYLNLLGEIGGFPALDPNWKPDDFDWVAMASHLNVYGCNNLLTEVVYPMFPFPFSFQKMELGFYVALNTRTFQNLSDIAYQVNSEEMLKILRLYGVDDEKSQIIIKDILQFIKRIMKFNIAMSEFYYADNFQEFIDDTKFESLDEDYKGVLTKYMNIAWNITDENSINEIMEYQSEPEKIILNKIDSLIRDSKPEVVANYLSLKLLYYLHGDLELVQTNNRKFCTQMAIKVNGYFSSLLYNSTIPDAEQNRRSEDLIKVIKELLKSLEIRINSTAWLDESTMEEAAEKISNIKINIGQMTDDLGDIVLNEMFKLNFTDDYENNVLELLKFKVQTTHLPFKIRDNLKNTTKPLEILSSAEVNAFYFVLDNSVYIQNGLLNEPAYNKDQPLVVKYSRLGYILGHELFHAFDSVGRHFDAQGEERNWWSNTSEAIYRNKSVCFRKELNKIYLEDVKIFVNGNKTSDESVADGVGIAMAYDAFLRNSQSEDSQWYLDNNISKEQLFFLSFSQLYCAVYSRNHILNDVEDEHPSDLWRVPTALKYFPNFSEHFQCKVGSKMNPEKQCKLF